MYQAIYRKWRPLTFDDMVGQEHITTTLRNQVINDRVGHAYLFCGTRGTGKTTAAKVLSRAVNCRNPIDGSPCNECDICKGLIDGSIPDVSEIDAASNTGVDNIRDLKEDTKFTTALAKYHVYIIDEVHMLSQNAFNALLKTLEEPPSHVIFILATTEPHKLPQTILSRCQRYDFRRIRPFEIIARLREIAYGEKLRLTDGAYSTIARLADGSMRDALSLLERVVSSCGDEISEQNIVDILGVASVDTEFSMADAIIQKDSAGVFKVMADVVDAGRDLHVFIDALIGHFRNLLVCKYSQKPEALIDFSDEDIAHFKSQAAAVEPDTITNVIRVLGESRADAKWLKSPRVLYEVALIKLCEPALDGSSSAMGDRINSIEVKLDKVENDIKDGIKVVATEVKPVPKAETPVKKEPPSKKLYNPVPKEKLNTDNPFVKIVKNWEKTVSAIVQKDASLMVAIGERKVTFDNDGIILIYNRAEAFPKQIAAKRMADIKRLFNKASGLDCEVKTAFKDEIEDYIIDVWSLGEGKTTPVAEGSGTDATEPTDVFATASATPSVDPLDGLESKLGDMVAFTDDRDFLEFKDKEITYEQADITGDDERYEEFLDEEEQQEI